MFKLKSVMAAMALSLFAGSSFAEPIKVGSKAFTEQLVIAEITKQYLESKGKEIELTTGLGSSVLREALVSRQVDIYWEYTGPALVNFHKQPGVPRAEMNAKLNELDAPNNLTWLDPSNVNDTYALAMRRDVAERLGIKTTSDLAAAVNAGSTVKFACNAEFYGRADGLKPLQAHYGFEFPRESIVRMDSGLIYQAVRDEQVEVGLVFSTDGRIPAFDFVVLEDDKNYHIPQIMTPVATNELLEAHPDLIDLMKDISSRLDDDKMAKLNARVDVEKVTVQDVAKDFLTSEGLI